jgi:L-ascorbate metabolism protein UlaG (beta-lactamase superfamily)
MSDGVIGDGQTVPGEVLQQASGARITFVGHATMMVEMDGVRVLTDPVLRRRIAHLHHHGSGLAHAEHRRADLLLLSHAHWDHLDLPSLRQLDKTIPVLTPRGVGRLAQKAGFANVQEMRVGETVKAGDLTITATPAVHNGARSPFTEPLGCLGFVIRGNLTVYFPGDTDIFPEMAGLVDDLDVALMPVWGWGPTLGAGHMTPQRAAEALVLLQPKLAIPIHWGTLYPVGMRLILPIHLVRPPQLFARHARELAPQVKVHILHPGDHLDVAGDR